MDVKQTTDRSLEHQQNHYTIKETKDVYLLKEISIPKQGPFTYAFLGGMWYSTDAFSFDQAISLPYPFTTYYTLKIPDINHQGQQCRSVLYVKMPVMIIQYKDCCYTIQFDPCISINDQEVFPFICLSETNDRYIIKFYLFRSFPIKQKQNAWLGRGRTSTVHLNITPGDHFRFIINISTSKTWQASVTKIMETSLPALSSSIDAQSMFTSAIKALHRSYDARTGSFLQLPWKTTPGFTLITSSYSLLSYEAVRLNYFSKWADEYDNEQFKMWSNELVKHFINPHLYTRPKHGEGIIWYNMTNLEKDHLKGFFYMDCGYAGYPGGQATISLHLLQYLKTHHHPKLASLVKESLRYIISTQQDDGSWPMAIKQEKTIPIRREPLSSYTTWGGTGECIHALLLGARYFQDDTLAQVAKKGLQFLKSSTPICYNGLRDIGIMEPEAFSALSIIDACIEAAAYFNDQSYLDTARTYACYTLPWFFLYSTKLLDLHHHFHPISYSITPRISPYEAAWLVSIYHRLSHYDPNGIWNRLAHVCFKRVSEWVTENGGLSEGVFPDYLLGYNPLPMEQTFATTELMHAASHYMTPTKETKKEKILPEKQGLRIEENKDELIIQDKNKRICTIALNEAKISYIRNASLSDLGIGFSFYHPYSFKSRLIQSLISRLRGDIGKYILGIREINYMIYGIDGPEPATRMNIIPFGPYLKQHTVSIKEHQSAMIKWTTKYHRITLSFTARNGDDAYHIHIDPIRIEVMAHDLQCRQVLFPVIGAQALTLTSKTIECHGFSLHGEFPKTYKKDNVTAVDISLASNWTHGGKYERALDLIIKKENK